MDGQRTDNGTRGHVSSKPGRRRRELRGEYAEVRELASVLRDVMDSHALTLRDLEEQMPYARTSIAVRLNGESRPEWRFVASFLAICAGSDRQAAAVLEGRVRPLWEAAAPGRVHRIPPALPGQLPPDVGTWVATIRETAAAQQVIARLQLSVSRNIGTVQGLLVMIEKLTSAARTLTEERDALRRELLTHSDTASELLQTRAMLDDTQGRLEAAEHLLAKTSRRRDEALRQREEAERLRETAMRQAEAVRQRLAQIEQHAIAFAGSIRAVGQADVRGDTTLMGGEDQLLAAEILSRVDDSLDAEASTLDQLQGKLASAAPDNWILSDGQGPAAPGRSGTGARVTGTNQLRPGAAGSQDSPPGSAGQAAGPVNALLQRVAQRQVDEANLFVRQIPLATEIPYDGEARDWLLSLTREAERSIDSISLSTVDAGMRGFDGGLWTSDLGARYLELQRAAIARHVSVRRIFIFENEDLARDETFLRITQMQRDIGVEVRMIDYQLIPDWMRPMIFDFTIFDTSVGYERTPATTFNASDSRPAIVRTVLSPTPERVHNLADQFAHLWLAADPERTLGN
jgi:hypothetical protein